MKLYKFKYERFICVIAALLFCAIWFYGAASLVWIVPHKNDEIRYYQDRASAWQAHARDLEQLVHVEGEL